MISYVLVFVYTLDEYISFDRFEAIFSSLTFFEGFDFLIFVSFIISILLNTVRLILKRFYNSNLFLNQFLYDVFISLSIISIIYAVFSIEYFSRLYLLILSILIPVVLKINEVIHQRTKFIFQYFYFHYLSHHLFMKFLKQILQQMKQLGQYQDKNMLNWNIQK